MSKKTKQTTEPKEPTVTPEEAALRMKDLDGLSDFSQDQTDDLVGFWDGSTVLVFRPLEAKLSDSKVESDKTSVLIIGELLRPTELVKGPEDEQMLVDGNAGDRIGVWGKPGMKPLKELCGVEVAMALTGEKDTGKPNPMKTYTIRTKPGVKGTRLPITADHRKDSKRAKCWMLDAVDVDAANQAPARRSRPEGRTVPGGDFDDF